MLKKLINLFYRKKNYRPNKNDFEIITKNTLFGTETTYNIHLDGKSHKEVKRIENYLKSMNGVNCDE